MPKFFVDVCIGFGYASAWTSRLIQPVFKVKRAPKRAYPPFRWFLCSIANHFLGDSDSNVKNVKKELWTSVKTLDMHQFGPHGHFPIFKVKRAPKRIPSFQRFSFAIENHCLCDQDSDIKNAKILCGHPSIPWLCIRLDLMASPTHFKVKRALKLAYPPFQRFSCAIANHFLGDPD